MAKESKVEAGRWMFNRIMKSPARTEAYRTRHAVPETESTSTGFRAVTRTDAHRSDFRFGTTPPPNPRIPL